MIRPARPQDAQAFADLLDRCSPRTRYTRFHGVVTEIPPAYLHRCLSGEHPTVVAEEDGQIVGFASVGPVFDEPDVHEVAVLIEDRRQGQGLGRTLLTAVFDIVPVDVLRMTMCRSPLVEHLAATLPVSRTEHLGCDVVLDIDVWAVRRSTGDPTHSPRSSVARRPGAAVPS